MSRVIHYTMNEKPYNQKGKHLWLQKSGYCGERPVYEEDFLLATKTERRITCLKCLNKIEACGVEV